MKKIILVLFCFLVLASSSVLASEDRYVFIIDKEGNTQLEYQVILSVDDFDMYLPSFEAPMIISLNITNYEFFDSYGKIQPKYVGEEEGYKIYNVTTQEVQFGQPYKIGYKYPLKKYTTLRYLDNYHFRYTIYSEIDQGTFIYVCIPENANSVAYHFDENGDVPTFNYLTYPILSSYSEFYQLTCPEDFKEYQIYGGQGGRIDEIGFDFSIPNEDTKYFKYNSENIIVTAPPIYQIRIEENIKKIEPVLSDISNKLNLNEPSKYDIYFISDTEKVFENDENALVSFENGKVFFKIGLLRDEDEFFQINVLRGIINSALMKTYGSESKENWWTEGALSIMALKLMKENNLPYSEIQELIDETQDNLKNNNKISELDKEAYEDNDLVIKSVIVNKIDNMCPDHIIKINKIARDLPQLSFDDNIIFNNFLIYNLITECSKDISPILDEYDLKHDDVQSAIESLSDISQKIATIKINPELSSIFFWNKDLKEIQKAKYDLDAIKISMKSGGIEESLSSIKYLNQTYEQQLKKYSNQTNWYLLKDLLLPIAIIIMICFAIFFVYKKKTKNKVHHYKH